MQHFCVSSLLLGSAATTPQPRQASFPTIARKQNPVLKKSRKSEKWSHPCALQQPFCSEQLLNKCPQPHPAPQARCPSPGSACSPSLTRQRESGAVPSLQGWLQVPALNSMFRVFLVQQVQVQPRLQNFLRPIGS